MPRDSSGNMTRVHNWTTDAGSAVDIEASRFDAENDDFSDEIEDSLSRSGKGGMSAALDMNSNKINEVTDGTAAADAATVKQAQQQTEGYVVTTGSSNAYVAAPSPAWTAYATGQHISINANFTNSGACTLNVSGLGAKSIKKIDGNNPVSGEIRSAAVYDLVYDGTEFEVVASVLPDTIVGSRTFSGNIDVTGTLTSYPSSIAVSGTSKTLALSDANTIQECTNASTQTITVPTSAAVALTEDTWIHFERLGAGGVTIDGDTGVTVNGSSGGSVSISDQYKAAYIRKIGSDTWIAVGALS